ncbi:MAG: hypothetical protein ABIP05_02200 [Nitrospiraceae bacterium]
MKKLIALFVFTLISSVGMAALSYAANDLAALGSKTVIGDVLKIEGQFYTVHDTAGHDVRLHIDMATRMEGVFKTGDRVEAQVTEKGHALSMKPLQPLK